jgi:hypothetical protein
LQANELAELLTSQRPCYQSRLMNGRRLECPSARQTGRSVLLQDHWACLILYTYRRMLPKSSRPIVHRRTRPSLFMGEVLPGKNAACAEVSLFMGEIWPGKNTAYAGLSLFMGDIWPGKNAACAGVSLFVLSCDVERLLREVTFNTFYSETRCTLTNG